MTEIEFYTGVSDPVVATHRLAIKVFSAGRALRIATPDEAITTRLDRMLWEQPEALFIPHCTLASPLRGESRMIVDHVNDHEGAADVLINLCATPPKFFARFERLIDIVGQEATMAEAGRERWKFYKARGYSVKHTDLSKR